MMTLGSIRTIAILFVSSVLTAAASAVASWSTQDFVTLAGAMTTCGLAGINLYQRFREEKRRQDGADAVLFSTTQQHRLDMQQARLDDYASEVKTLREQLDIVTKEAQRWLKMYRDISGGGQPVVPPPAGSTP